MVTIITVLFNSIAEAETNKRTYRDTPRLKMTKAPTNPVFIVNL